MKDNPSLTVRDWKGNNPIRVVLDRTLKLNSDFSVFDNKAKTLVITKNNNDYNQPLANQIAKLLYKNNINSIIIEGGAKTLQTFIDENLWDEARVFVGKITFKEGVKAPKFNGVLSSEIEILDDKLKVYRNGF